jgi:signal transduction histidine kinase
MRWWEGDGMVNESQPSMVPAFITAVYDRLSRRMRGASPWAERRSVVRTEPPQAGPVNAQFVATMFHELRTPLSVISGYTDLLLEGAFGTPTAEQSKALERISKSARELLEMIR